MNAMTIILSVTASVLVALLMYFWDQSNEQADTENVQDKKSLTEHNVRIRKLEEELKNSKQPGQNLGIQAQKQIAALETKLKALQIERQQLKDRLAARNSSVPEINQADKLTLNPLGSGSGDSTGPKDPSIEALAERNQSSSAFDLYSGKSGGSTSPVTNPTAEPKFNTDSRTDISASM